MGERRGNQVDDPVAGRKRPKTAPLVKKGRKPFESPFLIDCPPLLCCLASSVSFKAFFAETASS